ncbi:MAG: DNA polymerase Y family protein [Micromonosporaceae bacterium]|nr:DNA polymerase Y family protein [Micromonosporaceae bacterium]
MSDGASVVKGVDTTRVLAVWCPDWPVLAAVIDEGCPPQSPVAVVAAGKVAACSAQARVEGVRRGLRQREAQARCPELIVLHHDPDRDARAFEPVLAAVEQLAPPAAALRPGLCAIAARGPARYFGGERQAAELLVDHVADSSGVECQIGVADGIFAASHAARAGVIVPAGRSAEFLAPLDVAALDRPELVDVLRRLGIRALGAFAALPHVDVFARFGADAALAHRLARGLDPRPLAARAVPPDLTVVTDLEPPAERVDTAAFAARAQAEELHRKLARHGLACTRLVIEAHTENGEELTREWRHDGALSAADIADRVRWQLDGWLSGSTRADRPTAGVARLRLTPEGLVAQGGLQLGLWGDAGRGADRAHRALSRVQGLLGPDAVVTGVASGGRGPAEQVRWVPWGDERRPRRPPEQPWPGKLPAPAPALVCPEPLPAMVYGPDARSVGVNGRHLLTAPLCRVAIDGEPAVEVTSWAGPWPVDERWWAPAEAQRRARFQVCLADGRALLLALVSGRWQVEAVYD